MENKNEKPTQAEIKKQNADFPNLPASSEKNKGGETMKKEIHKTSELNQEGKTDNTEKSGN